MASHINTHVYWEILTLLQDINRRKNILHTFKKPLCSIEWKNWNYNTKFFSLVSFRTWMSMPFLITKRIFAWAPPIMFYLNSFTYNYDKTRMSLNHLYKTSLKVFLCLRYSFRGHSLITQNNYFTVARQKIRLHSIFVNNYKFTNYWSCCP